MTQEDVDSRWMREALAEAAAALAAREVPVGCVFVLDPAGERATPRVLGRAHNLVNEMYNACAHAELVALEAMFARGTRLADIHAATLYVNVEPCIMCAAALGRAGIARVVFGCCNPKFGGCGSVLATLQEPTSESVHKPSGLKYGAATWTAPVTGGILASEAVGLLKQFYARANVRAPQPGSAHAL